MEDNATYNKVMEQKLILVGIAAVAHQEALEQVLGLVTPLKYWANKHLSKFGARNLYNPEDVAAAEERLAATRKVLQEAIREARKQENCLDEV